MTNKIELISATVVFIKQATDKIKFFRLHYGENDFNFKPGQWIDLYAPIAGKNIGGYTIISSTQDKGYIDLAIRESSTHPVTKYLFQELKEGDVLTISQGQGKFFLPDELLNSPLTFIAGGIGITPILSMFRSINKSSTPVKIFYSAASDEDFLLQDELAAFTIFTATKVQTLNWKGEKSRINLAFLQKYNADFNSHFFICGPRSMIDKIANELQDYGVPLTKIHFEKWW